MAQQPKIKVQKLKVDYVKLNKVLLEDDDLREYMKSVAKKAKVAVQQQVDQVRSSKDNDRTPKQIQHGSEYYEQLVTSVEQKGRKRQIVSIWLNGNNSDAYEAEHGVLEKGMNDLRGRLSAQ